VKEPVDLYVAAQKKVQARQPSMVKIHFGQKTTPQPAIAAVQV